VLQAQARQVRPCNKPVGEQKGGRGGVTQRSWPRVQSRCTSHLRGLGFRGGGVKLPPCYTAGVDEEGVHVCM
jgi:hypothetical protein